MRQMLPGTRVGAPGSCVMRQDRAPIQMLPCPRQGQGRVLTLLVPCSKHGGSTRYNNFLGFLARHSSLSPSFLMVPCSILVACIIGIFPLISFLGEPDTALHKGRARFSYVALLEGNKSCKEGNHSAGQNAVEHSNPKTRIDKDCSARVLVPLKHFKLPILDDSFFIRDNQAAGRSTSFSQKKPSLMLVSTTLSPGSRFGGIRDAIALSS
ncbi:hypothetical protein Ahy_A06g028662 [Arachis hypogaea]|uniref:Uncharacterized protein n=1 Tax=Arachis hypogaea TaxID=3818 RepID=A0A445CRG5_ARAHY|nr:hypothetical protein Ahy_A06g028662 [Arachis hypogaea]